MKKSKLILLGAVVAMIATGPAFAAGKEKIEPQNPVALPDWQFDGFFGSFDQASLQRGFQVYKEACSTCHGMNLLAYRHLGDPGAPFHDPEYTPSDNPVVRAIAAQYEVPAGPNEFGEVIEDGAFIMRQATPTDHFVNPYPNRQAAELANNGAYPPDLSVITKARKGGADYLYQLMLGYEDPPEGVEFQDGLYYNPYFSGGWIAMPQIIYEDGIGYTDGTQATREQIAYDVTNFLHWAGNPELEERKRRGIMTLIYLTILAGLLYLTYQKIWRNVEH